MLTLRPLPAAADAHPDPLLRRYYAELLGRWRTRDRLLARQIDRVLAGPRPCDLRRRLGIEPAEWALIAGRMAPERYLTMRARKGVHRLLNGDAFPLSLSPLKNKRLFAAGATRLGLPAPAAFGAPGCAEEWLAASNEVVVKPNFSSKGAGVSRLARCGGGWRSDCGRRLDRPAARALVDRVARAGGIVQRAVPTATALAAHSPGALPTARIVTMRDENGRPEVVARVLRLGGGLAPVDNFNRGGLAALLERDGTLGAFMAHDGNGGLRTHRRHPRAGSPLPDRLCAELTAASDALALAAHRGLVPGHAVVGWDIGLGADGVVLIEGNWNPGTDIVQLLSGAPISEGRGGALYLHALARVTEADWARAAPVQRDRG